MSRQLVILVHGGYARPVFGMANAPQAYGDYWSVEGFGADARSEYGAALIKPIGSQVLSAIDLIVRSAAHVLSVKGPPQARVAISTRPSSGPFSWPTLVHLGRTANLNVEQRSRTITSYVADAHLGVVGSACWMPTVKGVPAQ